MILFLCETVIDREIKALQLQDHVVNAAFELEYLSQERQAAEGINSQRFSEQ